MNIISMKNGSNRKKFQEIRWDMEKKRRSSIYEDKNRKVVVS